MKKNKSSRLLQSDEESPTYQVSVQEEFDGDQFLLPEEKKVSLDDSTRLEAIEKRARNRHWEWDFRDLEAEEFPMALAWEYGRELHKVFRKYETVIQGSRHGCFTSDCLHPVFLDFIKAPEWPSTPYRSLTPDQRMRAFPRAPWKFGSSAKYSHHIIQEIRETNISLNEKLQQALTPNGLHDPCRVLLVVDLGINSNLVLKGFKNFLSEKDLLLSAGRPRYERDLTALGALRLHRYFGGYDYTPSYKNLLVRTKGETKSSGKDLKKFPFVGKANRQSYLRLAKARLGSKEHALQDAKPFFTFFRKL